MTTTDTAGAESVLQGLLKASNAGVELNGPNPWDPQVHDPAFYAEALKGPLGLGLAFVNRLVSCKDRPELYRRILTSNLAQLARGTPFATITEREADDGNSQSRRLAKRIGPQHYDHTPLVNAMVGPSRVYTCAYYDHGPVSLEEAQDAKQDLICEKLMLDSSHRVLDIGCGYGALLEYMIDHYEVERTVGISLAARQLQEAHAFTEGSNIEFRLQDYRDLPDPDGSFDRIVSVGMIEHVGVKNLVEFFEICHHLLEPEKGLMLAHFITRNDRTEPVDDFMDVIFPGHELPTPAEALEAIETAGFVMEDVHNLGVNYAKTLEAWAKNLRRERAKVIAAVGEELVEMYLHYLDSCQGAFEARALNVCQFVISPNGHPGGYVSVR